MSHDESHLDHVVEPEQVRKPGPAGLRLSRRALRNDPRATLHALVSLSLRRATTPAQRELLLGRSGLAAIVVVPTAAWVVPMTGVLRACAQWHFVYEATGPFKPRAGENVDKNLTDWLAGGGRVLGVTADPAWLPPSLTGAADVVVTIAPPDARVLTGVIAAVADEGSLRGVELPDTAGLDLHAIVGAIRKGSTPADCRRRLSVARTARVVPDRGLAIPSLDELHGYGDAMDWARELVADLAEWHTGRAPFPTGSARAVLAGPPGTGKTSLVQAIGRAGGLPVIATSVAAWFANGPGYLDSVIKSIDSTFAEARAKRPCVVLLDEIDAVPDRAMMSERDRSWWSPVVTHLLTVLDSATSGVTENLVIVGCTNHANRLDAALTRPGRLERIITIEPPDDPVVRERMLRTHLNDDLADADLTVMGIVTAGATGATLMAIVRDARRRARAAGRALAVGDLMAVAMPYPTRPAADERRYAVHECGHAAVALVLGFDVTLLSLLESATASASVRVAAERTGVVTRADCERRVTVLLAGMAAEEAEYGDRSSGSGGTEHSDLAQATEMLAAAHAVHGFGDRLSYAPPHAGWPDPRVAVAVERDMQRLYGEARRLVMEHGAFIARLVPRLVASRFLTGAEVRAIRAEGDPGSAKRRRRAIPDAIGHDGGAEEGGPSGIACSPRARPRDRVGAGADASGRSGPRSTAQRGRRSPPHHRPYHAPRPPDRLVAPHHRVSPRR